MKTHTFRRHVPGTVEQAMSTIMDVESWPTWRPGILAVAHVSDRPLQPGSVWVDTHALGRTAVRLTARAIEMDLPRVFGYALTGGGLEASVRWSASPGDEGVLVAQQVTVRSAGLRALLTGIEAHFISSQRAAMDALHKRLRESPQNQPPREGYA